MGQLDREIGKLHQRINDSKTKISNSRDKHQQLQKEKSHLDQALADQGEMLSNCKSEIVIAVEHRVNGSYY